MAAARKICTGFQPDSNTQGLGAWNLVWGFNVKTENDIFWESILVVNIQVNTLVTCVSIKLYIFLASVCIEMEEFKDFMNSQVLPRTSRQISQHWIYFPIRRKWNMKCWILKLNLFHRDRFYFSHPWIPSYSRSNHFPRDVCGWNLILGLQRHPVHRGICSFY